MSMAAMRPGASTTGLPVLRRGGEVGERGLLDAGHIVPRIESEKRRSGKLLLQDQARGSGRPPGSSSTATAAAIGIVSTQAQTMRLGDPPAHGRGVLVAPTPMIAPVMVCVVETGMPPSVAADERRWRRRSRRRIRPVGLSLVIFMPIVLTIRQPPKRVPRAIAAWQVSTTQTARGIFAASRWRTSSTADDPHRLLGVVGRRAEAVERRRDELARRKNRSDLSTGALPARSSRPPP